MILNERQLAITRARATRFEEAIAATRATGPAEDVDPVIHAAYLGGMESQLSTLRREIAQYLGSSTQIE